MAGLEDAYTSTRGHSKTMGNFIKAAYDALLPYADLPVMGSLAVVCFGSVHRPLGLAALTVAGMRWHFGNAGKRYAA